MKHLALASLLTLLTVVACTGDEEKPQEPIAPTADTSAYPEDPALASPEDPPGIGSNAEGAAGGDTSVNAEPGIEEPVDNDAGALTEDPFGSPKNVPKMNDKSDDSLKDVPETPPEELDIPVGEGMEGASQQGQGPAVRPTGKVTPKAPFKGKTVKKKSGKSKAAAASQPPAGKATRYVKPIMLNVRAKPDGKAKVVRRLLGGAKIFVEAQGEWSKLKDDQWVRTSQLSEAPTKKVSAGEAAKAWKGQDKWTPPKGKKP